MKPKRYLQICREATGGATGAGLKCMLAKLAGALGTEWAVLSDVDLAGRAHRSLDVEGFDVRVLPIATVLSLLDDAEQIIWATVFLCNSKESAETISGSEDFVSALNKAEGLIRVVDAGYYYVFGPPALLVALRQDFPGESKEGLPEELDFPE